jgi:hypothetical protein
MADAASRADDPVGRRSREWLYLGIIVVVALVVRLATMVSLPHIHFPDEIFQVLEPAHGLAFGYRIVPYEFQLDVGMRSWIVPGLLAIPMWLAGQVTDDPNVITLAANTVLVVLSLLVVVAAFIAGRRLSTTHAVAAGIVAATWFELIFHAGRTLTEVMATVPLVLALVLAGKRDLRRWDLVGVGVLLGICLVLRYHLVTGVAVIGLWVGWRHGWRVLIPLAVGAAVPLALSGLVDWWTWGMPFASTINHFRINVFGGLAASYGESPIHGYLLAMLGQWQMATPLIALLALVGARRLPLWLLTAAAIVITHSLVGHKEPRYIFPAVTCLVILAGIGTGEMVDWARRALVGSHVRDLALPAALLMWVAISFQLGNGPAQSYRWNDRTAGLLAFHWLHAQDDLCGLSLRGIDWWETGGYAHLHRRIPIYDPSEDLDAHPEAYDYVADRPARSGTPQPGYEEAACFADLVDEVCLYRRPGGCRSVDGFDPYPLADGIAA